jgi:hypothetical protein
MFVRFPSPDMKRAPAGDYPAGALTCGFNLSGRRESNPRNQFGRHPQAVRLVRLSPYMQVRGLEGDV